MAGTFVTVLNVGCYLSMRLRNKHNRPNEEDDRSVVSDTDL